MPKVIHQFDQLREVEQPLHLAMGVFDGVHIGHQAVISAAADTAKSMGGIAGVLTFEPHPIHVIAPHLAPQRILASLEHKRELLRALGVELLVVIPFDREFAEVSAEDFLNHLQRHCAELKSLAIGEDWKFGQGRQGDIDLLRKFGQQNDIIVNAVQAVTLRGERVSSTGIRQAIRDGDIQHAQELLGRPYTVLGTVIQGRQLGRTIGFPTANLKVYNEQLPCNGVWAVRCVLSNGTHHCGAANLGVRPSIEGEDANRLLEIHLLDFAGDIYGEDMEVEFLSLIRDEQKFDSLDALKNQIAEDVISCRNVCISSEMDRS